MTKLVVSATKDYLLKDGVPYFYLADTAWMAFPNLPISDWKKYLAYRRKQGFTALQMSILPVTHDTSISEDNVDPFRCDSDGNWDFKSYNEVYFDKAKEMVGLAVEAGFVPVLGVLWCCYVPGTPACKRSPIATAMPIDAVKAYSEFAAELFKRFDPIFFISGDAGFQSEHEEAYYMAALKIVRSICPDSLISMHIGSDIDVPKSFIETVDFYMYQSGHGEHQDRPYRLAQKYYAYPIKRPILNSEPCYEGHGRVGTKTRFSRFDVRKAIWQSLLSGAKMGMTYGAHGIWSFHRRGMRFLNANRSFEPFDWDVALRLEGAWDASYARWIFEDYDMFDIEPTRRIGTDDGEVVMSADIDLTKIAIYSPYSFDIEVDIDLSGYRCQLIDLENRRPIMPQVNYGKPSTIRMPNFNSDYLILATR